MANEETVEGASAPAAPVQSAPAPVASPPAPVQATNSDDSDRRFKGIQADLAKERRQRQQYEQQALQFKTQYETERGRVQALSGIQPKSPADTDNDAVRARFAELYPHLGELTPEDIQDMRDAKADRARLQDIEKHYWGKHGKAMIADVSKELSKEYGGELTKRQVDTITQAYVLRAQSDPEFLERHEAGDTKLVTEFAKEWVEDWFEPARRQVTKSQVDQFRRVPNGKDRNLVNQGEKKIDVNDPKAVEDLLVASYREKGGQFGRNQ